MCHTVHIIKIALNIYWLTLFWPGAPSYPASLGTPGQGDHPNNSFSYFPFQRKRHVSGQTGSLGKPRAPFWLFSSVSSLSHFGGHTESKKKVYQKFAWFASLGLAGVQGRMKKKKNKDIFKSFQTFWKQFHTNTHSTHTF